MFRKTTLIQETKSGRPKTISLNQTAVNRARNENINFHDLRHTFATHLAQRGVDIYKISKLPGHEDIKMTQCYSHHCLESSRSSIDILESDYIQLKTGGFGGL